MSQERKINYRFVIFTIVTGIFYGLINVEAGGPGLNDCSYYQSQFNTYYKGYNSSMRYYLNAARNALSLYDDANSTQSVNEYNQGIDNLDETYRNTLIELTIGIFSQIADLVQNQTADGIYAAMKNSSNTTEYPLSCISNLKEVYYLAVASNDYMNNIVAETKAYHAS